MMMWRTRMSTLAGPTRRLFEPEHADYRESFRRFLAEEVLPNRDAWAAAHVVPRELFAQAAAHGFLAMAVPEEYGGSDVDDYRFNVVLAEAAAHMGAGAAFAGPMLHTDVCLPYLLNAANDDQRGRWLPKVASGESILAIAMTEPGTGSDLASIQTRAERQDDLYLLNGQKTFITNGLNCDQVIVAAKTDPEKSHAGISLLVVDAAARGVVKGRPIEKLGQHASDTTELFFEDVVVPVEDRLGEEGSGFVQLMEKLVPERLILAVSSIAGCERTLEQTLAYVKERHAFGQPIGSFQNSRFAMAEMRTETTIGRTFIDELIRRHCDGEVTVAEAAMAKWWTTELLGRVTDGCLQLHGGYGYTREYEVGQAWIDARVARIYAGTNEIMKEIVGRSMGL